MEKLGIRNAELIAGHQSLFMDDKHNRKSSSENTI
jgi:hypothetical protein